MHTHEDYIRRCLQLAQLGAGRVSPNPMVGAVLVYEDRIIGEGWHQAYGQAHAEVNCVRSVTETDRHLIPESTMYVSLEPCAHWGQTPPCADLIVEQRIPRVVLGCTDTFSEVSGKGIARLRAAGVTVITGILEEECRWLNRRFFTRQERQRPYIILKWAQSSDGFMAPADGQRVMLSNQFSQKLVHKMRSEEDAILVGYRTALLDDPQLSNRYGSGRQPLRMVIDPELDLPAHLKLFDGSQETRVFNYLKEAVAEELHWTKLDKATDLAAAVIARSGKINSLIIEGGRKTLEQFIRASLWDEALVFRTPQVLGRGTPAPLLHNALHYRQYPIQTDTVNQYYHEHTSKLFRIQ